MTKRKLLELKKRLLALAISDSDVKWAAVTLYGDRAIVRYCYSWDFYRSGNMICLCDKGESESEALPIYNTRIFSLEGSVTPEEYIAAVKGPGFPITYLPNNNETLEEEGPKLTK